MSFFKDLNERNRNNWLKQTLNDIPKGKRILDAGAGELKNKKYCSHLDYVSQDFAQYKGEGDGSGLQSSNWDTSKIDIVSDIINIPEPDNSFDVILCSEVFEHIPNPINAIKEFSRLIKFDGKLIITAPFASISHMAPYYFYSGFSKYWYEYHLKANGFKILALNPNGDWFALIKQEISRLGGLERQMKNWTWPFAYILGILGAAYISVRPNKKAEDLACFGWHCTAKKLK